MEKLRFIGILAYPKINYKKYFTFKGSTIEWSLAKPSKITFFLKFYLGKQALVRKSFFLFFCSNCFYS